MADMDMLLLDLEDKMDKTIIALERDFAKIRTGKANPSILNDVKIDYYGVLTPITQVGSVSAPDAQSIVVKPWDASVLKEVEKAIQTSGLGLNPQNDGKLIRIPIPPLTEATRRDLAKNAKKVAEDNKVAIRNVRREGMEELKKLEKNSEISEDDLKIYSEEVQKLTDTYIEKIDKLEKDKEQDIMSI